jgi:hypothetical protein
MGWRGEGADLSVQLVILKHRKSRPERRDDCKRFFLTISDRISESPIESSIIEPRLYGVPEDYLGRYCARKRKSLFSYSGFRGGITVFAKDC